jgi:signal transduction histidine kinase/PAS domain-containing protein
MEITKEMLEFFENSSPGHTAIYRINSGAMETVFLAPDIPELNGMNVEEYLALTKKDATSIVVAEDLPKIRAAVSKCVTNGTPIDIYYRVIHKIRGFDWVHAQARSFGEIDGKPALFVLFTNASIETDVYRSLLDRSNRAVYVIDKNTYEILYMNSAARKYCGKGDKYLGEKCYSYIKDYKVPCESCSLRDVKDGEFIDCKNYSEYRRKWEHISAEYINWCGHDAFVQYLDDITESENMQRALKKEYERFETSIMATGTIAWEYDIKAHKIFNPSMGMKKLGFPDVIENVPDSVVPIFREDERQKMIDIYSRIESGEPKVTADLWFKTPLSNGMQCERIVWSVQKDEKGVPVTAYAIGMDITAVKLEEQKFEKSMHEMLTSNPDALGTIRINLTKNKCEGFRRFSPYTAETTNAKTLDEFINIVSGLIPSDEERLGFRETFSAEKMISAFKAGKDRLQFDYRRCREDGRPLWIRNYVSMLKNPETGDIESVMYAADISREKLNDAMLRFTSRETDIVAMLYTDMGKLEVVSANTPKLHMKDFLKPGGIYTYSDVCSALFNDAADPGDRELYLKITSLERIKSELDKNGSYETLLKIRPREKPEGISYRRYQYFYLSKEKNIIMLMGTDVTEMYEQQQKDIETERTLRKQAMAASEAKTDFLSRMSHDIRTPLNGIIGMTHIACGQDNPSRTADCLSKIQTSSEFLLGLVNDILDMSKAENNKLELHPEPYRAATFSSYIDSVIRPLVAEKEQKFTFDQITLDQIKMPGYVALIDITHYNQIFFNLLSNAVKYTPEGGEISLVTIPRITEKGRMAMHAEVRDSGIGMSEKFQKVLFEPFVQEDRSDVSEKRGTGLGLAITKKLVDLMGGTIAVKSEPGKGTTFTVDLEFDCVRLPADDPALQAEQEKCETDLSSLEGKHILLCEDHPLNQEIARALLEEKKMIVETADNGQTRRRDIQPFTCRVF